MNGVVLLLRLKPKDHDATTGSVIHATRETFHNHLIVISSKTAKTMTPALVDPECLIVGKVPFAFPKMSMMTGLLFLDGHHHLLHVSMKVMKIIRLDRNVHIGAQSKVAMTTDIIKLNGQQVSFSKLNPVDQRCTRCLKRRHSQCFYRNHL